MPSHGGQLSPLDGQKKRCKVNTNLQQSSDSSDPSSQSMWESHFQCIGIHLPFPQVKWLGGHDTEMTIKKIQFIAKVYQLLSEKGAH